MKMQRFCWTRLLVGFAAITLAATPVTTDKTNPHYYSLDGHPLLLITSAEHYGGVINKAFDYVAYFDSLKANGLNYTRIYPGAMFEPMGKFVEGNTLGPKMQDLLLPWARSNQPGYLFGGNKFDLDRWDEAYFSRLKQFISEAGKRGIVVEVCLFNYSIPMPGCFRRSIAKTTYRASAITTGGMRRACSTRIGPARRRLCAQDCRGSKRVRQCHPRVLR